MSVFISHKYNAKLFFQTNITPNLNISARMSGPIREFEAVQKPLSRILSGVKYITLVCYTPCSHPSS